MIDWDELRNKVLVWARANRPDDISYGAPYSYWSAALHADIITSEEYSYAKERLGNMWKYRGD